MEGITIRIAENEELLVAGRQVSPGYLGGVGADRFVMDGGKRWYRTGDKVLRHEDVYICKGRLDSQVKIAGHRVVLLDVETHLRSMDGVENAICFTKGDDTERHIVVVLVASDDLSVLEVRAHLEDKIPAYMLPRRVHCVDNAPTNRSGKLDRLALREQFEA